MTINNEQLRRENDVLKNDNTQLRTDNDAMKDEIIQLQAKQKDEIDKINTQSSEIEEMTIKISQLKKKINC